MEPTSHTTEGAKDFIEETRYKFSAITHFFLFCSGADLYWLSRCSQKETNKYFGIGSLVFMTALFAFISSTYAFYTIFSIDKNYVLYDFGKTYLNPNYGRMVFSWPMFACSLLFGLVWAIFIFFLDRFIVSTINKSDPFHKQVLFSIPRLIVAVFIALMISQPLEVWLFHERIQGTIRFNVDRETTKVIQEEKDRMETALRQLENNKASETDFIKNNVTDEGIAQREKNLAEAQANWSSELRNLNSRQQKLSSTHELLCPAANRSDSIRCSDLERSLSEIAKAKSDGFRNIKELLEDLATARETSARLFLQKSSVLNKTVHEDSLTVVAAELAQQRAKVKADSISKIAFSDNLFTQLEALDGYFKGVDVINDDKEMQVRRAMQIKYYIILALFLLFEIVPILSKLIMPKGEYDEISDVQTNKIAEYRDAIKASHKTYFNVYVSHNLTIFKNFITELTVSREEHASSLIADYRKGKLKLGALFQRIREDVVNDLPEHVGAQHVSGSVTYARTVVTPKTPPVTPPGGGAIVDPPRGSWKQILTKEKNEWVAAFKKWKGDLRGNTFKWVISILSTLITSLFIAAVSEEPAHSSIGGIISFMFTRVFDSVFGKTAPHT